MKAIELRAALIAANDINLNSADALVETSVLKQLIESCKARIEEIEPEAKLLAEQVLEELGDISQPNMLAFKETIYSITGAEELDYTKLQNDLTAVDENNLPINIGVEAFYNQNGTFIYTTDKFLDYLSDSSFGSMTTDEAQRIKLITYYTFNSIPLQANWKVLINYRIYAN